MEAQFEQWYNGDFSTLLPAPNINNGFALFSRQDLIDFNLFKTMGNTLYDAVVSSPPNLTSPDEQMQAWVDENFMSVWRRIERGAHWWQMKDHSSWAVFAPTEEEPERSLSAINPSHHFRIGNPEDEDDQVSHVIAKPWLEPTKATLDNPQLQLQDNRMSIWRYSKRQGVNESQVFDYRYPLIGQPISGVTKDPILALCSVGLGDSWYGDAKKLVARAMIMLTNGDVDLNRHNNPILGIPIEAYIVKPGQAPNKLSFEDNIKALWETVRPIIGLPEGMTGADLVAELRTNPAFEARAWNYQQILTAIQIIAGVPPQLQGQDIGKNQSGAAIERMQYRADAKASNWRVGTNACLRLMIPALSGIDAPLDISYLTSPYQTRDAKIAELLRLFGAKIIDENEVRVPLGYSARTLTTTDPNATQDSDDTT